MIETELPINSVSMAPAALRDWFPLKVLLLIVTVLVSNATIAPPKKAHCIIAKVAVSDDYLIVIKGEDSPSSPSTDEVGVVVSVIERAISGAILRECAVNNGQVRVFGIDGAAILASGIHS